MKNNVILITGASSDIGSALMRTIINPDTFILAHYYEHLGKLEPLMHEYHENILPLKADFLQEEKVFALIQHIKDTNLIPSKIIHCTAIPVKNIRFEEMKWEDIQREIDVQLRSISLLLKEFLPTMAQNQYGKVVFILTSYLFNVPPKFLSHYVTAKYALLGFMKSLASEYAHKKITINAISPSMMETSFLKNLNEKVIEITAAQSPLKRNATVQDIIPLIEFLLSDNSAYMTGVNIPVSGGIIF